MGTCAVNVGAAPALTALGTSMNPLEAINKAVIPVGKDKTENKFLNEEKLNP
ncbi:hypothetical protein NSMS1_39310 [Nostoc sp. MS1]|nr:hypothetical protein NSMS1_39310 [Nostoc sp. MS1]